MRRNPDVGPGHCSFCDEQKALCFRFDDAEDFGRDAICLQCLMDAEYMLEDAFAGQTEEP